MVWRGNRASGGEQGGVIKNLVEKKLKKKWRKMGSL